MLEPCQSNLGPPTDEIPCRASPLVNLLVLSFQAMLSGGGGGGRKLRREQSLRGAADGFDNNNFSGGGGLIKQPLGKNVSTPLNGGMQVGNSHTRAAFDSSQVHKMVCKPLLRRTQAGPGRASKQQQELT